MQKHGSGGLNKSEPSFKVLSMNRWYASGSDSARSSSIFHILSAWPNKTSGLSAAILERNQSPTVAPTWERILLLMLAKALPLEEILDQELSLSFLLKFLRSFNDCHELMGWDALEDINVLWQTKKYFYTGISSRALNELRLLQGVRNNFPG